MTHHLYRSLARSGRSRPRVTVLAAAAGAALLASTLPAASAATPGVARHHSVADLLASGHSALRALPGITAKVFPAKATAGNLFSAGQSSAKDVWAVGYSNEADGTQPALIEHFNGHRWKQVAAQDPTGSVATYLLGAAATGKTDAWAVGHSETADGVWTTVAEHWDGSQWSLVDTPTVPNAADDYFYAVSALAANNAWAVGTSLDASGTNTPLVEHWDGNAWSIVDTPVIGGTDNALNGVVARSANDVWAVGTRSDAGTLPLAEHWDGSQWSIVDTPLPSGDIAGALSGVATTSGKTVLAAGFQVDGSGTIGAFIERWTGTVWKPATTANPDGSLGTLLMSVSAVGTKQAWAVGVYLDPTGSGYPVIEKWSGKAWRLAKNTPPPGSVNSQLTGVVAPTSTSAWAFGETLNGSTFDTLTEHWNGKHWKLRQGH